MIGTILWFNDKKRYGFILSETEQQVFFHKNQLEPDYSPLDGDNVEFDIINTDKGLSANNVRKV